METFNALLTLSELKALYADNPVGICPLYKGSIGVTKIGENTFFTNGDNMDIIYKESSFWSDEA